MQISQVLYQKWTNHQKNIEREKIDQDVQESTISGYLKNNLAAIRCSMSATLEKSKLRDDDDNKIVTFMIESSVNGCILHKSWYANKLESIGWVRPDCIFWLEKKTRLSNDEISFHSLLFGRSSSFLKHFSFAWKYRKNIYKNRYSSVCKPADLPEHILNDDG